MSISQDDLVGSLLDHQARVNFVLDDADVNSLVTDLYPLSVEVIGATEVPNTVTYAAPHHWGDGHSFWGFVQWGN